MKTYTDSGFKKSRPSTTDWLLNWVDAQKKAYMHDCITKDETILI